MAIEFNDQLEAIWQVMYERGNWLAAVSRQPPPGVGFKIVWRFRYYLDDDLTQATKDLRNWYEMSSVETQPKRGVQEGQRGSACHCRGQAWPALSVVS